MPRETHAYAWWSLSDDVYSIKIECVACRQVMWGESRIFNLSPDGAFVLFHTCKELLTNLVHVTIGAVRAWGVVHHIPLFQCW